MWVKTNKQTNKQQQKTGFESKFLNIEKRRCNAAATPLRKAASYEPRIAILGILGDTWLTRGKYGIYMYVVVTGSKWRLLPRQTQPYLGRVSYVAVTRIPSLVLRNTWHFVIIRYSYGELPKFVLRYSNYEAAIRKGVTTALVHDSMIILLPFLIRVHSYSTMDVCTAITFVKMPNMSNLFLSKLAFALYDGIYGSYHTKATIRASALHCVLWQNLEEDRFDMLYILKKNCHPWPDMKNQYTIWKKNKCAIIHW